MASTIRLGVSGVGFVGIVNSALTGDATLGVDTSNVGHPTITNEAGTEVIEVFAKCGSNQIDVRTPSGLSIG